MPRTHVHDLNREVRSIAGWYMLHKEERLPLQGQEYLYMVGEGVVDSSCCGVGGCRYAVVPGSVVSWKSGTTSEGLPTSQVEPVEDPELQEGIRKVISAREGIEQVQFL